MNAEHKITFGENCHFCHDDLLAGAFVDLDGYKQHFADEWGCTVGEMVYELIDLEPIERARKVREMQARVNAAMEQAWDRNERERMAGWRMDKKAEAQINAMISWSDAVWAEYESAAERIMAGEEGVPDPEIPQRPFTWKQIKENANT
jgi:hypothetical protein